MEQTANQMPPPGSPKKKKWPKILGGVVAFIILAVGLAFYFTAGMVGVVDKQLALLRRGDIKGAYSLTSKDFQKATSLEQFTVFVKQYPSLSQNQGHTFTTRTVENNIGTVKGTLTARDGAVTPVMFQLVKEQGQWRILFIEARATGAGTGIKGEDKLGKGEEQTQASPPAARLVSFKTCERVAEPGMTAIGVRNEFNTLSPELHALVQMKDVKQGSELKGSWIAVDAIREPNYVIDSSVFKFTANGDATVHLKLSKPTKGWPPGNYRLDIYLDDVFLASAPFSIKTVAAPVASQPGTPELVSLVTCEGVEGYQPVNIADQFNPESPKIYVVAKIKNVRVGTKATGVWIAVDALRTPNREIYRRELVFEGKGMGNARFQINKPNKGWPVGTYKLDLYIDGNLASTAPFKVAKTALPGSSR